ncbi:uncharacterized protein LOC126910729 isoform X4 [Spodoptera frugiperda]|uniref:Uncharacterized protein LOC126910729 isoform X4 n=1 Tax=Spodoptera frugiperda TaxID=7108 RepID=A0A9R0EUR0_SPOFR|nr:uncharacterized protein LOC126910729 isoform X4 [Spodoptera frugiperda]
MWKIVTLSAFLIVAQAADIKDIYGDWIQAAFYPVATYVPICIHFNFAEIPDGPHCTYSDGSNATIVGVSSITDKGEPLHQGPMAMLVVNTQAEIMPALNLTVTCAGVNMRESGVVRVINKDYFILYFPTPESMSYTLSETEPNNAALFGRKVVSAEDLTKVMLSIEELKGRRGAQMCATENYGGFEKNEA